MMLRRGLFWLDRAYAGARWLCPAFNRRPESAADASPARRWAHRAPRAIAHRRRRAPR